MTPEAGTDPRQGDVAYDRTSVDRFLAAACEQRVILWRRVAETRSRLAELRLAAAERDEADSEVARLVLEARHAIAAERRGSERGIASIRARAELEAVAIIAAAHEMVRASRDDGYPPAPAKAPAKAPHIAAGDARVVTLQTRRTRADGRSATGTGRPAARRQPVGDPPARPVPGPQLTSAAQGVTPWTIL